MSDAYSKHQRILFFDGHCGLCDRFVNWYLARSHHGQVMFSPLQGETAKALLSDLAVGYLDTVVYWRDGRQLVRSSAVIRLCCDLGGLWSLSLLGLIVPPLVRDGAYRLVANHRFRFFGRSTTCRIPSNAEASRFLP